MLVKAILAVHKHRYPSHSQLSKAERNGGLETYIQTPVVTPGGCEELGGIYKFRARGLNK
jgi:hypothetical protein